MIKKSAGGVLFSGDGHFVYLIQKKERNEWLLPKGGIKEGEGLLEAAAREITEETGYLRFVLYGPEPANVISYTFTENDTIVEKRVYFFVARLLSEEKANTPEMVNEGLGGKWFTKEDAVKMATHEEVKETLRKAYEKVDRCNQQD